MEENFDLLAQSRANYYTKGSPVQFVRVELLKGDVSGEIAVCLSFKNITARPLNKLAIRFRCKDREGQVVCADQFFYEDLNSSNGQIFGSDDAVYISSSPVGSVEVDLEQAVFADGTAQDLSGFPRVRLQPAKKLPADIAEQLCLRTHKEGLTVVPQVTEDGWYCACGAFHPTAEEGVWCSECGADRILLQNTLSGLLQQDAAPAAPSADAQPTRMASPVREPAPVRDSEPTRMAPPVHAQPARPAQQSAGDDSDMHIAHGSGTYHASAQSRPAETAAVDAETARKDEIAELIIRWAPPVTAVLCAITAVIGFILI